MASFACKEHWEALVKAYLDEYGQATVVEVVEGYACEFPGSDCRDAAYVEVH